MIIGSGSLKGRSLKTLGKEPWLRPTSDKAREAVMDMMRPILAGARFIDVCSGTGAVGIEALSNGATHTTFVDVDNRSVRLIVDNLRVLGLQEQASVVKGDADGYVSGLQGAEFDVLFADPPFDSALQERLLVTLSEHLRDAADGCIIIMEHPSRRPVHERYDGPEVDLESYKERRYGDVSMTFFRATKHKNEVDSSTHDQTK
ncbi:MAG TPA: 16S rRNA (guanine(966)-N(2))-methyltransferase RsmD [Candidatus Deferrimicrobium sp.]|nr:16S rRNA (guanine(966)-N(2))-methyltransferase RsmD [Candidatus Deferrimicrobium sp.]